MNENPTKTAERTAIFTREQIAEIADAIKEIRAKRGGNGEIVIGLRRGRVRFINTTKGRSFGCEQEQEVE